MAKISSYPIITTFNGTETLLADQGTAPNKITVQIPVANFVNILLAQQYLTFTSITSGLVPASGGGTANFLRADATFTNALTNGLTVSGAVGSFSAGLNVSGAAFTAAGFEGSFNTGLVVSGAAIRAQAGITLTGDIVPTANNSSKLGSTSFAYAQLYMGANKLPAFSSASGIIGATDRTAAEVTAGVTPTDYSYSTIFGIDIRRYGAVVGGSASTNATAITNAILVALAGGQNVWIDGAYSCTTISATITGAFNTKGLRICGTAKNASSLTQSGAMTQLINLQSASPTTAAVDTPIAIENLSLFGSAKSAHGLSLQGIANWHLSNVDISAFDRGLNIQSSLIGTIDKGCFFYSNNTGMYARRLGTDGYCNLITVRDSRLNGNSSFAVDFGQGSSLKFDGCDFENNGTSLNTATGAIVIRSTINAETGYAMIEFQDCWFEANYGQTIRIEAATLAWHRFSQCQWLSNEAGLDLLISGAECVTIESSIAPSTGATWNITCNRLHLKNVGVNILTDASVVPYYENVSTASGAQSWGRHTQATLTLTGCTTSPTTTCDAYQQGDEVKLRFFTALTATSNTTACTLTGVPASLRPAFARGGTMCCIDNGLEYQRYAQISAGGVLTLSYGTAMTNSGNKGFNVTEFNYRLGS